MRRISFVFVLATIVASATGALAQTGAGGAAGGAAAPGANAGSSTGGHAVGSPSAGSSARLGSGAAPNGAVQQHPTEPGCPGSALPSTTPGMKPAC
jgi:hypothetical protein